MMDGFTWSNIMSRWVVVCMQRRQKEGRWKQIMDGVDIYDVGYVYTTSRSGCSL